MEIAPEYLLAGVLFILVAAIVLVVAVAAAWMVVQPDMGGLAGVSSIFGTTTTTTTSTTTSTTTTDTTTSTTSTTTTTTSTSTSTTMAPFYVCDMSITESAMVTTKCQEKPPMFTKTTKAGPWLDMKISATIIYNLTNAVSTYDDYRAKIGGSECMYFESGVKDMKFNMQQTTCAKPVNLTKSIPGTLKTR